jgi:hypothetical protein
MSEGIGCGCLERGAKAWRKYVIFKGPANNVDRNFTDWTVFTDPRVGVVNVRVGDTWKTRMPTINVALPPPTATGTRHHLRGPALATNSILIRAVTDSNPGAAETYCPSAIVTTRSSGDTWQ